MCEECQWFERCLRLGEIIYNGEWKLVGKCLKLNLAGKGGIIHGEENKPNCH